MRSKGEFDKGSDREERFRHGSSESDDIKKPSWRKVKANNDNNLFLGRINVAINKLHIALEKEFSNVHKS